MQPSSRFRVILPLVTGGTLVLAALAIRLFLGTEAYVTVLEQPILAIGLIVMLLSVFPAHKAHARIPIGICVSIVTVLFALAVAEVAFRLLQFDFHRQEAALRRLPPYYRKPTTPSGKVFFRRNGPEEWTGQVMRTAVEWHNLPSDAYRDEPVVTVRYDHFGFRNEGQWDAWEIAVAGDSFTELGDLPYEQLFTSILGRLVGRRVLNLGVSHTGPLTQLSYLEDYGVSPRLEQAVIVFYEGNDLSDIQWEFDALQQYEEAGIRNFIEIEKQTSLVMAIGEWLEGPSAADKPRRTVRIQYWRSGLGDVPVTLMSDEPPGNQLDQGQIDALDWFCREYRAFGTKHEVRIWLAYMPCKVRVVHRGIQRTGYVGPETSEGVHTSLPDLVAERCGQYGIGFIDLTPTLAEEAEQHGRLVFNAMYDNHLNALGANVVAQELAQHLGGQTPQPKDGSEEGPDPSTQ